MSSRSAFAQYLGPYTPPTIDDALLRELADIAVLENQACARKVALAATIFDSCIHQTILVGDHITDAGNYAASETAKTLRCSKTIADTLADIGMDLRLRLPAIKAAFDVGELDLPRVRAIYRGTASYSLEAVERVETEILQAARRLTPGPLATEISAIMTRTAPEETAALRAELTEKLARVRYRDKDIIATIDADLPAADAAACWQLINEMAATLCPRDPRTRGQRLAAAYIALLHRESHLSCTCDNDDAHPCTADPTPPDRRTPLTNITIDLHTLLGIDNLPAHLAEHGLIDADHARRLTTNSTWQLLVTEAHNLTIRLGLDTENTDTAAGSSSETPDPQNAERPKDAAGPKDEAGKKGEAGKEGEAGKKSGDPKGGGDSDDDPAPLTRSPGGHLTFHPLGRGRRRRGLDLPTLPTTQHPDNTAPSPTAPGHTEQYRGTYTLIAALEKAIAADPTLAQPLYPNGHGGHTTPPPGALTYRPNTALADTIRYRDRTCRHPGCDVPATACDIDHVTPYNHHNPTRGGWTIPTNLHCLCRYHHTLKTIGAWTPTVLAGAVNYWTSNSGTTAITMPGNNSPACQPTDTTLIPHIPRKRRTRCSNGTNTYAEGTDADEGRVFDGMLSGPDEPAPF